MTQQPATRKWRPPLALVLFGALASMVGFSALSVFVLRFVLADWGWPLSLAVIGAGLALVTLVVAWLLTRLILGPVTDLAARARAGGEDARRPLPHYGTPEIEAMGEAVREMAARLHIRAEDLRAYADHVTHELKSPLTTIRASAEMLSEDAPGPLPARITEAAGRMQALLDALHALSRAAEGAEGSCKGAPIFLSAAKDAGLTAEAQDFEFPLSDSAARAVFDHLAGNAQRHGATHIAATKEGARITVSDNGQGVSDGNRDRIFDPFFTTRRAEGGTGMGLAIIRRMLAARGASITLLPGSGGARFAIDLSSSSES
ncbi:MAG: HAMP domain-containing sensor histidine kinase [Pseudomonadota bacterium]